MADHEPTDGLNAEPTADPTPQPAPPSETASASEPADVVPAQTESVEAESAPAEPVPTVPAPPLAKEAEAPIQPPVLPLPNWSGQRSRMPWSRILGVLAAALVFGTSLGLSVPVDGRSGWSRLADGDLGLPVVFPWHKAGPVDPGVREWVYWRGAFAPPVPLSHLAEGPNTWCYGWPQSVNYDRPPTNWMYATWLPALGADPLAPSRNQLRGLLYARLAPADFAPIAAEAFVPIIMYHDVVDGEKLVSFDLTTAEFEEQLNEIAAAGCTPISLRQWWNYATRGDSLPEKPVMLTFDDGYDSIYNIIYPRLKKRGWPATYFIVPGTVGKKLWSKGHVTWAQCREMLASGLCDIQSHTMTHPDLTKIDAKQLRTEIFGSRDAMEKWLGRPTQFLCYPMGLHNEQTIEMAKAAGYVAAFIYGKGGSAQSKNIYEVARYNETSLAEALRRADAGPLREVARQEVQEQAPPPPAVPGSVRDYGPVKFHQEDLTVGAQKVPMCWVTGGRPVSVHCDYRYAVGDVAKLAGAVAGINGSFFQLARVKDISNAMLGPVMSQLTTHRDTEAWRMKQLALPDSLVAYNKYVPGEPQDIVRLVGRPYVLIGASSIRFAEFHPERNSLAEAQKLLPDVTDAFVAGGWLVRNGQPLTKEQLDRAATRDHNDFRRRAWIGIDANGVPMIGACPSSQRSEIIARAIASIGVQQGALLDSGFSTSLLFNGDIYVTGHSDTQPSRPVPHMILILGTIDQASADAARPPDLKSLGSDPGAASNSRRRRRR